ncbi:MAG: hypothetical protein WD014_08000 [Dongiaceae bacterium]
MRGALKHYREAVRQAIARAWAAGLPAYQGRGGYLVALYPDGRRVKLKKLENPFLRQGGRYGATKALASRRSKRRR